MELKEVIGRRRTIRFYLPFRPVERAKIQKMLEAARHASCAGNVMNVRAIVIWREQASPELLKAITPGIGYQQMQTAPVFILWCSEASVYHGANWIESVLTLAENRRIGLEVESTQAEINTFTEMFAGMEKGQPVNDSLSMARSTMLAILGRMATHSGDDPSSHWIMHAAPLFCTTVPP